MMRGHFLIKCQLVLGIAEVVASCQILTEGQSSRIGKGMCANSRDASFILHTIDPIVCVFPLSPAIVCEGNQSIMRGALGHSNSKTIKRFSLCWKHWLMWVWKIGCRSEWLTVVPRCYMTKQGNALTTVAFVVALGTAFTRITIGGGVGCGLSPGK